MVIDGVICAECVGEIGLDEATNAVARLEKVSADVVKYAYFVGGIVLHTEAELRADARIRGGSRHRQDHAAEESHLRHPAFGFVGDGNAGGEGQGIGINFGVELQTTDNGLGAEQIPAQM